jgi:hypothetical protein
MGQGTYTSIAMLIAEKLEIDLKQLRLAPSPASRWRRAHLPVFGLMGEDFLRILRVNELLGEIECCLQIRFGGADRPRADVLGARLQRLRGCLLSGLDETFESLASLLDALRGKITDFGGDFVGDLDHGLRSDGFQDFVNEAGEGKAAIPASSNQEASLEHGLSILVFNRCLCCLISPAVAERQTSPGQRRFGEPSLLQNVTLRVRG